MSKAILLDLAVLVREQKEIGQFWTENIRNVYGIYLDDLKAADMDGTVQDILYRILGEQGMSRMDIDSKMELFINEMAYAYYNVAGRDNMSLAEGAKEALNLCKSGDFVVGIATPITEKIAQNMMERTKIDPETFKFTEFGGLNKEANSMLMAAVSTAKSLGAEPDNEGVFVSSSPSMLSSARAVRIKTIAVTNGQDQRFEGLDLDAKIKSLRELRKAIQKVTA